MNRYRAYGDLDDQPLQVGDENFVGVDEYNAPENVKPGNVQAAVNVDFTTQDMVTRGGAVCLPELGASYFNRTWKSASVSAASTWRAIAYGASKFVAVAINSPYVMSSPDGINWTSGTAPAQAWNKIAYGNGLFVAISTSDFTIMTSPDGLTWTSRTNPMGPVSLADIAFGNGKFVISVTGQNNFLTSSTGTSWSQTAAPSNDFWGPIVFGNGLFVVTNSFAGTDKVAYSSNGTSWTLSDSTIAVSTITYGNGIYVAVGGSSVMTSPDGATWTTRTAASSNSFDAIAFGNGMFVAVAYTGTGDRAMLSTDGIHWISMATAEDNDWVCIAYGANRFVSVASSGTNRAQVYYDTRVYASGVYSDPDDAGSQWIMLVGTSSVGFYQFGKQSRSVSLGSYTVSEQSTIVQCNNQVYLFRGADSTPLYWTGDWSTTFDLAPTTTPAAGFSIIPNSNQATYYQNRLWVVNGKDEIAASDVLDFTAYDDLANSFNLNTGNSDFLVTTFPFGDNALVVFKNKSIVLLQNVSGSLADVTATEITRQVGAIGINSVVSVGPDLAYVSDRNVNLLSLTSTNNAVQHKTLPLSVMIKRIMRRVNWNYAYKISMAYWDNKLYVALPLDNATKCNAVVVYNFVTSQWFGEWNFATSINMGVQGWASVNYLGLQRLHAISEDGRIFVMEEGQNDISGAVVAEITSSVTTRAYTAENENHFQRRMFIDCATNRPSFSITAYTEGVSESSEILTDQTFSRSDSWIYNDSTYDLTNANDDYNRAYRKDYSTGPDSVQCGTGFQPEAEQEQRIPVITRRNGRLSWLKFDNTQGLLRIMSVGFEARKGFRSSLIQT